MKGKAIYTFNTEKEHKENSSGSWPVMCIQ